MAVRATSWRTNRILLQHTCNLQRFLKIVKWLSVGSEKWLEKVSLLCNFSGMTVQELIAKLEPIVRVAPDAIVMLSKGGMCRINRNHDGLHCGPHDIDDAGDDEVVVIH